MIKRRPERSDNPTEPMSYAAGRLGVGINQAYTAAARGEIPVKRIGKRMLVLVKPFEAMLEGDASSKAA